MAKKSRRARIKSKVSGPGQGPEVKQSQPAAAPAVRSSSRQPANVAAAVIQPVNYDYVKSDLVRIGIIAGALILVIIVLTFVPALK
jgi:hypothetical protein